MRGRGILQGLLVHGVLPHRTVLGGRQPPGVRENLIGGGEGDVCHGKKNDNQRGYNGNTKYDEEEGVVATAAAVG